jgi:serine/threonine protein kinase
LFNEEEASKIIKGVMNGLHNIHEMNYIHRDLKPDNIQLAPKGMSMDKDLKIIDFGLSAK